MINRSLFVIFCTFLYGFVIAQSPTYKFETITVRDGLSQSSVHCIYQDSKGYLWFGTEDGLNRYDGYNFKVYREDIVANYGLNDNSILSVGEDHESELWIGTKNAGLHLYNYFTEQFVSKYEDIGNKVNSLFLDSKNRFWAGTELGLFLLKGGDPNIKVPFFDSLSYEVNAITEDKNGTLWVGTRKGLVEIKDDLSDGKIHLRNYQKEGTVSSNHITALYSDDAGITWIGTWGGGLNIYHPDNDGFIQLEADSNDEKSVTDNRIQDIIGDNDGNIWIASYRGLSLLKVKDREKLHFTNFYEEDGRFRLTSNDIRSMYQDHSGMIWFGTYTNGLCQINPFTSHFTHYKQGTTKLPLNHNLVFSILLTSDSLLLAGMFDQGLNVLDLKNEKSTFYTTDNSDLKDDQVWSLFQDKSGEIWIGTFGGGLQSFDPENGLFTDHSEYLLGTILPQRNFIWDIFEDSEGFLWIATNGGGLLKYNKKTKKLAERYVHNPNDLTSISHNQIWTIFEDSNGMLWIGTNGGGLNRFDRKTGEFIYYQHQPGNSQTISHDEIWCVYEDSKNNLWIGTNGGGLNKLDRATGKFKSYRREDGISNNVVYGILEDEKGNLWLSTNNGLTLFNPTLRLFDIFYAKDGLQSNEFNANAYHKGFNDLLYFGGINGITEFSPLETRSNTEKVKIIIDKVISYQPDTSLHVLTNSTVNLGHQQNAIVVHFTGFHYAEQGEIQYSYYLEGLQNDFQQPVSERSAVYANLSSGTYTFRVKASHNGKDWSEPKELIIRITPAFWQQMWFRFIIFLLFIITIALLLIRAREWISKRPATNRFLSFENDKKQEIDTRMTTPVIKVQASAEIHIDVVSLNDSIEQSGDVFITSQPAVENKDVFAWIIQKNDTTALWVCQPSEEPLGSYLLTHGKSIIHQLLHSIELTDFDLLMSAFENRTESLHVSCKQGIYLFDRSKKELQHKGIRIPFYFLNDGSVQLLHNQSIDEFSSNVDIYNFSTDDIVYFVIGKMFENIGLRQKKKLTEEFYELLGSFTETPMKQQYAALNNWLMAQKLAVNQEFFVIGIR